MEMIHFSRRRGDVCQFNLNDADDPVRHIIVRLVEEALKIVSGSVLNGARTIQVNHLVRGNR